MMNKQHSSNTKVTDLVVPGFQYEKQRREWILVWNGGDRLNDVSDGAGAETPNTQGN